MAMTLRELVAARSRKRGGKQPATAFTGVQKVVAMPLNKTLAVLGTFGILTGEQGREGYKTMIVFTGLNSRDNKDQLYDIQVDDGMGEFVYMERPSFSDTKVLVTCTCADFYWTWWWYVNSEGDALAGTQFPPPHEVTGELVRKRDQQPYGTIPGSRNDQKAPGVCKHLVVLSKFLMQKKWITFGKGYSSQPGTKERQSRLR